jgi:acetolactate synthase-1/3 small subunit
MRHIISLLLENEPGALSRVVGLFSQRNYNIESLTVAPTEDPTLSRLTLTTAGHEEVIEQITKTSTSWSRWSSWSTCPKARISNAS